MSLSKLLRMDPGPQRDKLSQELGYTIKNANYPNKPPSKFKDEVNNQKLIHGDPESKGKREDLIESEIEFYLYRNGITFWNTKIKGEIQSIGKSQAVLKKSKNKGFPDILCCINGQFVGIEVKGYKKYQSTEQIEMETKINKAKGKYLIVTSVRELDALLKQHNLI